MSTAQAQASEQTVETNIPARLDRLPWSRWHWMIVFGLGTVWILDGLEVDAERMRANLDQLGGMVYSEALLLAMVAKGADRQAAYRLVQGAAKRAWSGETTFRDAILADAAVAEWLTPGEIERAMDLEHHLAGIDVTFRALGLDAAG